MHQSPQKLPGGCREKRPAAVVIADDGEEVRAQRLTPPKARRYLKRDESPRGERSRQHPRG